MTNTLPGLIAAMFGALLVAIGLPGQWLAHAMPSAHAESRMLEARVPQSGAGADAGAGAGAGGLGQPGHREPLASDLAILMSQASQYQPVQVRQPAQARLHAEGRADGGEMGGRAEAGALLRDEIRRAHSLRGDHFVPQVRRILAAADKFEPYGVDYLPAVRAVRDALAEPHPNGGDLRCRQVLDRWLAKHARTGARQAQRLAPGLA